MFCVWEGAVAALEAIKEFPFMQFWLLSTSAEKSSKRISLESWLAGEGQWERKNRFVIQFNKETNALKQWQMNYMVWDENFKLLPVKNLPQKNTVIRLHTANESPKWSWLTEKVQQKCQSQPFLSQKQEYKTGPLLNSRGHQRLFHWTHREQFRKSEQQWDW